MKALLLWLLPFQNYFVIFSSSLLLSHFSPRISSGLTSRGRLFVSKTEDMLSYQILLKAQNIGKECPKLPDVESSDSTETADLCMG